MKCKARPDSIFLYAAGALEPDEHEEVRAHLASGCPKCAGALAEAEAALALIPLALDPIPPSQATREMLMSRVAPSAASRKSAPMSGAKPTTSAGLRTGRFSIGSLALYSGLAAAVVAVITGLAVRNAGRGRDEVMRAQVAQAEADKTELQKELSGVDFERLEFKAELSALNSDRSNLQDQLAMVNAEKLQLVSLGVPEGKGKATGRVFWDVDGKRWHVVVFNLKPLATGQAYQLWAIPDGGKPIPMNTFTTDASGKGTLTQLIPAGVTKIKLAAITNEPAAGSPQPTGTIQLAGEVK